MKSRILKETTTPSQNTNSRILQRDGKISAGSSTFLLRDRLTALASTMIVLLCVGTAFAQNSPKNPERGFQPGSSYAISDLENINTTNGNLIVNIPLVSLPKGRGEVGKSIGLVYNSKLYDTMVEEVLDDSGQMTPQNLLKMSENGGWRYTLDNATVDSYTLDIVKRYETYAPPNCNIGEYGYQYKVFINMPDGSKKEFRPTDHSDIYNDGFFNVTPDGKKHYPCPTASTLVTSGGMTYYSIDGSYTKLIVDYVSNAPFNGEGNSWTMYMSNGSKVRKDSSGVRFTDRNGNYIQGFTDNFGRSINIQKNAATNEDHVTMQGFNNQQLKWKVKWKTITFSKQYKTTGAVGGQQQGGNSTQTLSMSFKVVDKIILPTQAGSLEYVFNYNTENNLGYGELSKITTPAGAVADYEYRWDNGFGGGILITTDFMLDNSVSKKTLTYLEEYDGASASTSDVWQYNVNDTVSTITSPDGTVTTNYYGDTSTDNVMSGLVHKTSDTHGNISETRWDHNRPTGANTTANINAYAKTTYNTVPNDSGTPSLTKIVDYSIDPNGNITETKEYDWVAYSTIPRDSSSKPNGIPSGATLKRTTSNVIFYSASSNANYGYWKKNSHAKRDNVQYTTVKNTAGTPVAHTRFIYASTSTKGNLTETRSWDSTKGAYTQSLSGSNWVRTRTTYDTYGNPINTYDANDNRTLYTYGAVNGHSGLYPTKVEASYGTAVERTSTTQYDFHTGAVTLSTDVDNNVSTANEYDPLGRPTKVKGAVGTTNEIWDQIEYSDAERRVITKSDLNVKGDAKIVSIKHYDQLGRIRLARSLENAATQSPTNEAHGIKVQTRYKTTNPYSYSVRSNPYRASTSSGAGSEQTMGWTRSKAWNTGRRSESETFSGSALPAPWGGNSATTGKVIAETDAEASTVTDQAGKKRRSITNALGQLIRVDEPNVAGNLGIKASPIQPTSYSYDTLNNLKTVNQGAQTRTFTYSSLSRLLSANNPESGNILYTYDPNGNLLTKKDARNLTTTHTYDPLNRVKTRTYTDGTPTVTYTYDNKPNAKGLLTKVSSSVSTTEYQSFDKVGKVLTHRQTTDGVPYNTSYLYNLSGALLEETYPSGRKVKNTLDTVGRLSTTQTKTATGSYQNRFLSPVYAPHGAASSIRLGNNRYESTQFNARLQPTRIALGTSANATNLLKLDFGYGTTVNNGNVLSQTITTPAGSGAPAFTAVQTYTYDSLNRIKDAKELVGSSQKWKQVFTYDRYGNRRFGSGTTTITGCPANICNPTISASDNRFNSGQGYTYDLSGNVIADAEGRTFIYDGESKQKQVKNSSNQVIGTYYYDGDGRRVKKVTASKTEVYVYDVSGKLVAEYSTLTPQSVPVTRYLTSDHLGSPRVLTSQTGAVLSRRDFMPFGEEIKLGVGNRLGGHGYTYGDSTRQKFTSYERDEETNLDYAKARMYSTKLARFTAPDPLLSSAKPVAPDTWNRYAYVVNNPLNFIDPNGLCSAPAGLKKGQVGICFEAFISAKRIGPGGIAHGDGRSHSGNDASLTARVTVWVIVSTDKKSISLQKSEKIDPSHVSIPGGGIKREGTMGEPESSVQTDPTISFTGSAETGATTSNIKSKVGEEDFGEGVDVTVSIANAPNGVQKLGQDLQESTNAVVYLAGKAIEAGAPKGTIDGSATLRITGSGQVSYVGGKTRPYPSYAVYAYTVGSDGKTQQVFSRTRDETPPVENLTKPQTEWE